MSDKHSSPSVSSGSGKSPNSRSSSNGNGDEPYLVILTQPPKYAYSNESFDVELQLETPKTASPPISLRGYDIELEASLQHEKTKQECGGEALLITEPSRIVIKPSGDGPGRCKVTCMIRMDSIRRDIGASLELRFRVRPDPSLPVTSISGVSTNAIHLVNYKLRISLEEDWGPVWYKDEGGRDKSMEIFAGIYDKDGQLRTGEQIPLYPTLCYECVGKTPIRVTNQDILRTLGASKIVIDKDTGRARIRFRVEDVSKNHQAQDFILEVGTDPKAKSFKDVAPAYTPAVNVRSKRNKRSRNQGSRLSTDQGRRSSPISGHAHGRYDNQDSGFEGADVPRLREAMKSVINWADEVVNGLYPLQWQVLGYAQHPDGSADYARPYHNMPNPNPCINRVLGLYSDSVRESLRILMSAVDQAGPRSEDPSYMAAPMTAPIPRPPGEDMYGIMRTPPAGIHGPPGMPSPGMPPGAVARLSGMHPPPQEAYREKPQHEPPMYQARAALPPPMHQAHPMATMHQYMRPQESEMMPMHPPMPPRHEMPQMAPGAEVPMQRPLRQEEESRESEVEYILAKQYKAARTGERLGFPAYSANKEILGFYRDATGKVGVGQFTPLSQHRNEFGPLEIMQATDILDDAIAKKSQAVHSLKDWGSIANLLDRALVYDWSKDINDHAAAGTTG